MCDPVMPAQRHPGDYFARICPPAKLDFFCFVVGKFLTILRLNGIGNCSRGGECS